jgi:hypothetical protein
VQGASSGQHTAPISDQAADPEPAGPTASTQSSSQQAVAVADQRGGCGGGCDQTVQLSTGKPSKAPRPRPPAAALCWSNAVGEQLGSWMVKCWMVKCNGGPCAAAKPASRGAVARHARLPAIRERSQLALASPAARQGGLRDWLPQCHGHRQRSAAAAHAPAPKKQQRRPPNATACPSHRRSRRRPSMLKEHASPQPMVSQRH